VARFDHISQTFSCSGPTLMQNIVADFMNEGHFARHIQRMRKLYAERRRLAAEGLAEVLGKHFQIDPQPGGMHMVLRMKGHHTDRALALRMQKDGMAAQALSTWTVLPHAPSGLMLSFTNIDTPQRARQLARRILKLL